MELNEYFAVRLKAARKAAGYTQYDIAEKLNYTSKSISKWESGKGMPPADVLVALSGILNVSIDSLLIKDGDISYYLGIDGGGTKTKFRLCNEQGEILDELIKPASNPSHIGFEKTLEILKEGIDEICKNYPANKISLFAGLSGFTSQNRESFLEFFRSFPFAKVDADQDIAIISEAGLGDQNGIVAIMGTGSVVRYVSNGEVSTIGGFGAFFDCGGSGFKFGSDAIKAVLRESDGSGEKTILTEKLREFFKADTVSILSDIYRKGPTFIASVAPLVIEAAKQGDRVAMEITDTNCKEMAHLIDTAAKKVEGNDIPVIFAGGMCVQSDYLFPIIRGYIRENRNITLKVLNCDPVIGALIKAGMKG